MLERIILTCNYSPWSRYSGGGQRSTHALASALSELGYDVQVLFTKAFGESLDVPTQLPYRLRWVPFIAFRSDGKNPFRAANAVPIAHALRDELRVGKQGTVVNAQGEEGALAPHLCRKWGAGFVQTPRYPKFADPIGGKLRGRLWLRPKFAALGHALRHADRICPTSRASATDIVRLFHLSPDDIDVIPNGIAAPFLTCTRSTDAQRGPIVYFGRLSATKGVSDLVHAWLRLEDAPELWIGGEGPEEEALKKMIFDTDRREKVRWLGWCTPEEMAKHLCQARAAVLPSLEESFGNTMVEAMAAGTPLITTRAGSIPEVVGDASHATLLEPSDRDAIKRTLVDLQTRSNWFETRAVHAQNFAREHYSWRKTAQRYVAAYEQALTEKSQ